MKPALDYGALLAEIREKAPPFKYQAGKPERTERQEAVSEYARAWDQEPGHQKDPNEDYRTIEAEIVRDGQDLHKHSWAHTEDDREAWYLLRTVFVKLGFKEMVLLMEAPGAFEINAVVWTPKWAHYGFQLIDLDDKYAASLAATKVNADALGELHLPWPCFLIRIPPFLRHLTLHGEPLRHILVNHVRMHPIDFVRVSILTANKSRVFTYQSLADMAKGMTPALGFTSDTGEEWPMGSTDLHMHTVIERLVVGTCVSLTDPATYRRWAPTPGLKKPSVGKGPRSGLPPQVALFKVGANVVHDVRQAISDYITGTGKPTTVRTLVTGHWKRQPHGPRASLRRLTFVECYWRGDEDAPLIRRAHVVNEP